MAAEPFHLRARSVGLPTFFQAAAGTIDDVRPGSVVVAGAPIDQGIIMSKPGARLGPRAIREASVSPRATWEANPERTSIDVDTLEATRLCSPEVLIDIGDFPVDPADILRSSAAISAGVAEIVRRGGKPVVLGGDHYVPFPCVKGLIAAYRERRPEARIGYLHVDSHPDIRDRFGAIGGQHNQSSSVRRISELDGVSPRNMAWLGLNGAIFNPETFAFARRNNLKIVSAKALRQKGIAEAVREVMEVAADGTDGIYVSVDIDVCNSSDAPGTGSPVFTGLTAAEFLDLMHVLGGYEQVAAVDLCEVSPALDPSGATADLAAEGLLALLRRHLFETVELPET